LGLFSCPRQLAQSDATERMEVAMNWVKPEYEDLRLGFELTLYINAR
jgi:coenzyme PQQ precursor peptide PqqA